MLERSILSEYAVRSIENERRNCSRDFMPVEAKRCGRLASAIDCQARNVAPEHRGSVSLSLSQMLTLLNALFHSLCPGLVLNYTSR
jgi:hypothetical protein